MSTTKVTDALRNVTAVDAAKITTGTVDVARLPSTAVNSNVDLTTLSASNLTSGTLAEARLATLDATKLTGSIADARIPASAVTQHVAATDLTSVRQDIAMLAIYNSVSDNRAAYNLPSSFIDTFQDGTGLTTTTDVALDATGEYVNTVAAAAGIDSYTKLALHSNTTNGSTTFTDSSSSAHGLTAVANAQHTTSSLHSGFGTSSIIVDGSGDWVISNSTSADWSFGTGDFTVDFWARTNVTGSHGTFMHNRNATGGAANRWWIGQTGGRIGLNTSYAVITGSTTMSTGTWYHVALIRSSGTLSCYLNGVSDATAVSSYTVDFSPVDKLTIGGSDPAGAYDYNGQLDEIRISKGIARWTSNFTPPTSVYTGSGIGTTGTLISDTQTSSVATTKMSGVILYKDNAGTNTLGTHLKIYLSANGGTNWTEVVAADFGAVTPLFSAGVKMVRLAEQTVTSGTAPVMKAVWAGQSVSLEAQLHGWAVNY